MRRVLLQRRRLVHLLLLRVGLAENSELIRIILLNVGHQVGLALVICLAVGRVVEELEGVREGKPVDSRPSCGLEPRR